MASLKADVARMVGALCADHGCSAKLTKAGHWRVTRPGHQPVTMSQTPSDNRALANMKRDIKIYLGVKLT